MGYLFVVAHPDDEILGAGGTIFRLTQAGIEVHVCILSSEVQERRNRPEAAEIVKDIYTANAYIGVHSLHLGKFPNISFNTVPHIDLVKFVEEVIEETGATNIYTHHPSDLNNDHIHVSFACQAAARLFQRKSGVQRLRELCFMEVPSSTDWSFCSSTRSFNPNSFFLIGKEGIERKISALRKYRGVSRVYPHSRSIEALTSLAVLRGSQAGQDYSEAFETVFRRMDSYDSEKVDL